MEYLGGLRPKPEYVRLFREIVLDSWKTKQEESKAVTHLIERRIRELEEKRQNLLEAHVYRRTIEPEYVRLFREIVLDFFECPARV